MSQTESGKHLQGPRPLLKDLKQESLWEHGHGGGGRHMAARNRSQPLGDEFFPRLIASGGTGASVLQQMGTEFG